jgi:hypothetical protein
MKLTAISDQVVAAIHERQADIERVASKSPETWTHDDMMIAWLATTSLAGFLVEGRL